MLGFLARECDCFAAQRSLDPGAHISLDLRRQLGLYRLRFGTRSRSHAAILLQRAIAARAGAQAMAEVAEFHARAQK